MRFFMNLPGPFGVIFGGNESPEHRQARNVEDNHQASVYYEWYLDALEDGDHKQARKYLKKYHRHCPPLPNWNYTSPERGRHRKEK